MTTIADLISSGLNFNNLPAIATFSIPCVIGFIYGYSMTFKTDQCLEEKRRNLEYWFFNDSPTISSRQRRMARFELFQRPRSNNPKRKMRLIGILVLGISVLVEIIVIGVSLNIP